MKLKIIGILFTFITFGRSQITLADPLARGILPSHGITAQKAISNLFHEEYQNPKSALRKALSPILKSLVMESGVIEPEPDDVMLVAEGNDRHYVSISYIFPLRYGFKSSTTTIVWITASARFSISEDEVGEISLNDLAEIKKIKP